MDRLVGLKTEKYLICGEGSFQLLLSEQRVGPE